MDFCFDFVMDPVELLQETGFTPDDITREDLVEITKYGGKTTIRYGEAFFLSLRKAIHICFINDQRYLTVFEKGNIKKYTFDNNLDIQLERYFKFPLSIQDIIDEEKLCYGTTHTSSWSIPISLPRYSQHVHSAPV